MITHEHNITWYVVQQLEEAERVWKTERDDLLRDQAGLQNLHDNLLQDYDKLMKDRETQKEVEKQLRDDIRKLQVSTVTLNINVRLSQLNLKWK